MAWIGVCKVSGGWTVVYVKLMSSCVEMRLDFGVYTLGCECDGSDQYLEDVSVGSLFYDSSTFIQMQSKYFCLQAQRRVLKLRAICV